MRQTRILRHLFKNPENIPNQKGGMWQDPVFGYFESHGKTEFKAGEEYDITEQQKKQIMERYIKKERLKREYLLLQYNPQRYNYIEGCITDPSMFRWYASDMSHTERFRVTPRTGITAFVMFFVLWWAYHRWSTQPYIIHNEKAHRGENLWWDRSNRWITECGTGVCRTGQTEC